MKSKYELTEKERRELEEYRGTGLSPRQIKAIKREAIELREYREFLRSL